MLGPMTPEEIIDRHHQYATDFSGADLDAAPSRRVAVVACMDARLDIPRVLGLAPGEAHVIRNAGGVVTDDVIRSLALSQRELGTRAVVLVHHTRCGLEGLDEDRFTTLLEADSGQEPAWRAGSFDDPREDTRACVETLQRSPFIAPGTAIHGFVYDVETGTLERVG